MSQGTTLARANVTRRSRFEERRVTGEDHRAREDHHHLLADATAEVGQRVLEVVDAVPPLRTSDEQLEADEEEEERDREGDVVADLHGSPCLT